MKQTPAHEMHNGDLLKIIPPHAKTVMEVGCSSGALAREYKKMNPQCLYLGIELDADYAQLARRHCDRVLVGDIETLDSNFWLEHASVDCWIFSDVLEHLKDPWACLKKIHSILPDNGRVVACIPNVQHWSIPVNISVGNFHYQDIGLLDRTHLRWFTRKTMHTLFQSSGYVVEEIVPRIFDEPQKEVFLPIIQRMARRAGGDPQEALRDALPLQYLIKAKKY